MSGADSDRDDSSLRDEVDIYPKTTDGNTHMTQTPLMTPPPLYSTDDYKIDGM